LDYLKKDITELGITPVDGDSPIPYYHQVRIDLMNLLRSGVLNPGDMLPSEDELCGAYGVGRQTLRKAVSRLVNRQLLERTPGRGTTVLQWKDRTTFFINRSFAQQIKEIGLRPHSEVLRKKNIIINESSPASLQGKMGSHALELFRLRFGDETPIGVQYTTVITDICRDLSEHDFRHESLYDLLLTKYRLPIMRIDNAVRAIPGDEWHRSLLKISKNAPLLVVDTTAYLDHGEPIETSTSYYRADQYEFSISKDF